MVLTISSLPQYWAMALSCRFGWWSHPCYSILLPSSTSQEIMTDLASAHGWSSGFLPTRRLTRLSNRALCCYLRYHHAAQIRLCTGPYPLVPSDGYDIALRPLLQPAPQGRIAVIYFIGGHPRGAHAYSLRADQHPLCQLLPGLGGTACVHRFYSGCPGDCFLYLNLALRLAIFPFCYIVNHSRSLPCYWSRGYDAQRSAVDKL